MNQNSAPAPFHALEACGLSVILGGQKVLDILSLQVLPNEVLIVIGPNGSGKTTLLLSLALLLRPATGTISYQGQTVSDGVEVLRLRRRFAVVFQEPLLLNTTVWDNVTLGLRLRGVEREERKNRTQKWLERFGIASLAPRQAKTLSGGEAKRVSLARAFALRPEVLFLDEPFAALDSPTRQALIEDFESVLRETKVSTVMVTHDRNEAVVLANRVAVLLNGHIRQIGTPEEIFSCPVDEEVASFVGIENIIAGVIVEKDNSLVTMKVNSDTIQAISDFDIGKRVYALIRPEDVTLTLSKDKSSARNTFKGKISKMTPVGPVIRIEVDCGFPLLGLVTKKSAEELNFTIGKEIYTSFKATAIRTVKR